MAIISPLAYTIANGDPVDATPVQANLNQIVQDVNANAAPVAGSASQQFLVASTTNPAGAVPLLQVQQQFAALNGSSSQNFAAATLNATTGSFSGVVSVAAAAAGSTQAPQISQVVGAGATAYTNVTANRSLNTSYTNNTGRPLFVVVGIYYSMPGTVGAAFSVNVSVNGSHIIPFENSVQAGSTTINASIGFSFFVPPGNTYEVSYTVSSGGGVSSFLWNEY